MLHLAKYNIQSLKKHYIYACVCLRTCVCVSVFVCACFPVFLLCVRIGHANFFKIYLAKITRNN